MTVTAQDALVVMIAASIGTYGCRALGVRLSRYLHPDGEIFRWLTCVTYSMIAALTVRMIVLPVGLLSTVPLWARLLVCAASFMLVALLPRARMTHGLVFGLGLLLLFGYVSPP